MAVAGETAGPVATVVTLVIVHHDQPERCLATEQAFLDQGVPMRIVVVDNDSTAANRARLDAGLREAEVLAAGGNLGFGPGANVGLRDWLARPALEAGEWVLVAPHDALPEPGCVARLLDEAGRRPRAGLACADYGEGLAGGAYGAGKPVLDRYFGAILAPSQQHPGWESTGYPHGTLLLARRSCLEDIGLFDERYFAYCEEADLGERARRAGWEVGIVWGAIVRNPSWSVGDAVGEYLKLRNSLLLIRTHFGRYAVTVRLVMAVSQTGRLALRPPARRPPEFSLHARLRAMTDFLRGRTGPPPPAL